MYKQNKEDVLAFRKRKPKDKNLGSVFTVLTQGQRLDLGITDDLATRQVYEVICQAPQREIVCKTTCTSLLGLL